MPTVRLPTQLQVENVVFSDIKKVGKSKVSYINYTDSTGTQEKLLIQIPKLFAPFGASYFNPENKSVEEQMPKYNISLALNEEVKGVVELKNFLNSLDKLVCKKALQNKSWMKELDKNLNEKAMKYFYTSMIKVSENKKYPDSLSTKVPVDWNNKQPELQLFNKHRERLEITFENIQQLLPKLLELKGLIQISHIWFVNKKFGIIVKLIQGMVYPRDTLTECVIKDDEKSEEESEEEESEEEESEE